VGVHAGNLSSLLMDTADAKRVRSFTLSTEALLDIEDRIEYSRVLLDLADSTDDLVRAFLEERIPQSWFAAQNRRRIKRNKMRAISNSKATST
jgi:hypothetical protein